MIRHPYGQHTKPYSIRLSNEERLALLDRAGEMPLSAYIRLALFEHRPARRRSPARSRPVDRKILAELLGALGASRIANNLNQLAHAANTGNLHFDHETKAAIRRASDDIHAMRLLLMQALGLKLPAAVRPSESTSQSFARAAGGGLSR